MGDFLRLWVFIGGCCDVISRVGCTPNLQDLQCGIPRCCILVSGDFLTMCVCVLCDWRRNVGEGDGERKVRVMGLGGLLSASLGLYTYAYL